jgi:hypothetical protein
MTRAADNALWVVLGLAAGLFVGWGIAPQAAFYTSVLSPERLIKVASLLKLGLLAAGAAWAWRCRRSVGDDGATRGAWALLAGGIAATFVGQACLAPYQLGGGTTPFPSVADVFYVLAYPLLGVALFRFVIAYSESGYPVGTRGERTVIVGVAATSCVVLAVIVLRPVLAAPGMTPAERALTAAYPALDLVLLVPLALLLRISLRFRGGALGLAWIAVLAGIVFMCAADVLFAYFTALGLTGLDPFVHATFITAYGLLAAGMRRHLALLTA